MTMYSNKYIFCGCKFEICSDEKLISEGNFSDFLADFTQPDYSFKLLKTAQMPEKEGKAVFESTGLSVFENGCQRWFSSYLLSLTKGVTYACREDYEKLYFSDAYQTTEHNVFEGLRLPQLLLEKGVGLIHCSFIECEGQAILFAGDKQVGKSTQAGLWEKYACATVINGDRAGVYFKGGVVFAGGVPYCGTSKICINKQLPVKAIVCLSKGTENTIKKLSAMEAFTALLGKFTYDIWNKNAVNAIADLLTAVVGNVPVFSYSCVKDESAVIYLKNTLERMA